MKKYYYVSYEERYKYAIGTWLMGTVIDGHPLAWCREANYNHTDKKFTVVSWQEIDEQTYNEYREL
jgi:hypothetical protein